MDGEDGKQQKHLVLAHNLFLLTQPDVDDIEKVRLRDEVFTAVVADGMNLTNLCYNQLFVSILVLGFLKLQLLIVDMAPLYETLATSSVLKMDQKVLDSMRAKIDDELKKLDEKSVSLFSIYIYIFGLKKIDRKKMPIFRVFQTELVLNSVKMCKCSVILYGYYSNFMLNFSEGYIF